MPGGCRATPEWQPIDVTAKKARARTRSVLECNLAHANLPEVRDAETEFTSYADVGWLPTCLGEGG
jgi:hypothetical protein